jgi:hypothetical protein
MRVTTQINRSGAAQLTTLATRLPRISEPYVRAIAGESHD